MWCFCFLNYGLFPPLPPLFPPSCAPSSSSNPSFAPPLFTFLPPPPLLPPHPTRSADASHKYQISKPTVCSVHPGEVLKLSCPLPPTGTITWTKDGSSLGTNNRTVIEQEVLQIRDATAKDSGLYACTSVGKDTVCFIVNVTGESGRRQGLWTCRVGPILVESTSPRPWSRV